MELQAKPVDSGRGDTILLAPDLCVINSLEHLDSLVKVKHRGSLGHSRTLTLIQDMPTIEACTWKESLCLWRRLPRSLNVNLSFKPTFTQGLQCLLSVRLISEPCQIATMMSEWRYLSRTIVLYHFKKGSVFVFLIYASYLLISWIFTFQISVDRRHKRHISRVSTQHGAGDPFVTHPQISLTFWLHEPVSKAVFKVFGPLFLVVTLMLVRRWLGLIRNNRWKRSCLRACTHCDFYPAAGLLSKGIA